MRTAGRTGRTVALRLRFADYSRASRSRTLAHPTAATRAVLGTARGLLVATMPAIERKGLTLVGITVSNLERGGAPAQLALPVDDPTGHALDAVLDGVRDRFGSAAVSRATSLGQKESPSPVDIAAPRSTLG